MTDVHSMSDTELNDAIDEALTGIPQGGRSYFPRPYASDGNGMLALIEAMRERGKWLDVFVAPSEYVAQFGEHEGSGRSRSNVALPRAVAEAALLAIRAEGTDAG